jgi:type I restriction enzyme S subunit
MEVRPGYKQTEVGVIPNEWAVVTLRSLVRKHNSGIYKRSALYGSGCNIIGVSDIYDIDRVDGQVFARVPLSEDERAKHTLESGDLLYGESSLVREGIARTVYVTKRGEGTAFAWHTRRYSVDQGRLLPAFFYYYLQARPARKHMMDRCIQTAITGINTAAYFSCPILAPPLSEQRAIATALSDVDTLLAKLDQLIDKKCDLKQAAMQQLLTGQTRLPGFSGEWEVKRLGDVARLYQPVTISAKEFTESGYPVYGANGVVGFYRDFNHEKSQVTVTCRGSTCGTVNRTVEKSWITGNAMVVNCDYSNDLSKDFLYYLLLGQDLSVCITGTGQPQIVRGPLANFELSIPRDVNEQSAIAIVLSDMDAELVALETRREKTRALKQGMMQELLTGRIRLV